MYDHPDLRKADTDSVGFELISLHRYTPHRTWDINVTVKGKTEPFKSYTKHKQKK